MIGGKVVVGVSTSLPGLEALRYSVAETRRWGARLHAVRAWQFRPPWQGADVTRQRAEFAAEATQYIYEAFDAAMGGPPTTVDLVIAASDGRADMVLTGLACERCDLLVLGAANGRRPSWVVRNCLRHAICPVVIVPPPSLASTAARTSIRHLLREITHHSTYP